MEQYKIIPTSVFEDDENSEVNEITADVYDQGRNEEHVFNDHPNTEIFKRMPSAEDGVWDDVIDFMADLEGYVVEIEIPAPLGGYVGYIFIKELSELVDCVEKAKKLTEGIDYT